MSRFHSGRARPPGAPSGRPGGPSLPAKYTVRESPKARHIRLKMSVQHGLEVIVPKGFARSRIPPLLEKKRRWIQRAWQRIEEHRKFFQPPSPDQLPDHIILRAIGETWRVTYRHTKSRHVGAYEAGNDTLVVRGNIASQPACKAALRRWLARRCREKLVPWLCAISRETQLPFGKAMVRTQKTRWASCSRHKTISLNAKLLFLPPNLVRYVFVHELCHTVHLNHSAKFWALVGQNDPHYQAHDRELRKAWRLLPHWPTAERPECCR